MLTRRPAKGLRSWCASECETSAGSIRGELARDRCEGPDTGRDDDSSGADHVVVDNELETTVRIEIHRSDVARILLRCGLLLEPVAVREETVDGNRRDDRVADFPFEVAIREPGMRVPDIAAAQRRPQQHVDRCLGAPELERLAEHADVATGGRQMGRRRQSIRTGADDCDLCGVCRQRALLASDPLANSRS